MVMICLTGNNSDHVQSVSPQIGACLQDAWNNKEGTWMATPGQITSWPLKEISAHARCDAGIVQLESHDSAMQTLVALTGCWWHVCRNTAVWQTSRDEWWSSQLELPQCLAALLQGDLRAWRAKELYLIFFVFSLSIFSSFSKWRLLFSRYLVSSSIFFCTGCQIGGLPAVGMYDSKCYSDKAA